MHVWQMAWPPYALTHGLNPFYTYWLNAPVGSNLMWDVPPLPGIVMWPVTAIAGPIASYNALAVIAIALSGACMFIAARAITKSHVAAAVAGLVYAFSPFMLASASGGHTSLTLAFCPPLLLFLGYDTLVRRKWRSLRVGIATGAVLAAQYMTFPEGVAIAAVGTLVMVTWSSVMGWRRIDRALLLRTATVIVSAALTMALLAYPAAAVMFFGRERLAAGTVHGPDYYVSDLLGFVLPAPSQAVSFNLSVADHFTGNPFEWTAYLGIPLLLILLVTVCLLHRRRSVLTAFATLVTVALLSMGPHLHLGGTVTEVPLPWSVLQSVPLLSFLLPGRLIVLVFLMAALLLACLVAALRRRPHSLRANLVWLVTLAGFGAIAVSWWPPTPFPIQKVVVPAFFSGAAVDRIPEGATVLVLPYDRAGGEAQVETWQAAAHMRFRMPEGYVFSPTANGSVTGPTPTLFGALLVAVGAGCSMDDVDPEMASEILDSVRQWVTQRCPIDAISDFTLSSLRQQLSVWNVSAVVVGPNQRSSQMVRLMTRVLGAPPSRVDGVTVWWTVRNQV